MKYLPNWRDWLPGSKNQQYYDELANIAKQLSIDNCLIIGAKSGHTAIVLGKYCSRLTACDTISIGVIREAFDKFFPVEPYKNTIPELGNRQFVLLKESTHYERLDLTKYDFIFVDSEIELIYSKLCRDYKKTAVYDGRFLPHFENNNINYEHIHSGVYSSLIVVNYGI